MTDYKNNLIFEDQLLKEALERLNKVPEALTLFVLDRNNRMVGTLTDGDVRRGLLEDKHIGEKVSAFMKMDFRFLRRNNYTLADLDDLRNKGIKLVPLLDQEGRILRVIYLNKIKSLLPVDAVIMAGGRGERLRPLTDKTPKSLLRVGGKPIIEHNLDRLINFGVDTIHICIQYMGDLIKDYVGDGSTKGVSINYLQEEQPLGTLGAVSMISAFNHDYVLVMNSDLLTNIDFEDFFRDFIEADADMAIVSIPYKVNVPYAVLETNGASINSFKEKPTYTYYSNGGIYLLKKEIIGRIPPNQFYNATDLMEEMIRKSKNIIHYPLLGYWLDIGRPEDYEKAQQDIKHIKL